MKPAKDSHAVIDALYRISSLSGDTEDPKEALNTILDEILQVLGAHSASVALISPDTNRLEIEVYRGMPEDLSELQLALGQGVTGWVALHNKPILVNDVRADPRYFTVKETVCAEMAVPMEVEGMVVGVVNVDSETLNAFDDNDLKVLTLMTNEATKVVSRLWLINQLRGKARQLESVIETGQKLVTKRDIQEVMDTITQQALGLLHCRLCALYLLAPDGRTLRLQSLAGSTRNQWASEEFPADESSVGVAIQRRKQIEVFNVPRTEEHPSLAVMEGLSSLLATPLVIEDDVIGVLNVYTDQVHRFNNDERRILATLASLGAVAIQNSRLYTRVFASEETLRKSERLTTLGLLAAEIAHEIRNPLTVIKLLLDSLDLHFPEADARAQDVRVIGEKLDQLEEIVERVLGFGKSTTNLFARWNLTHLIEETLRLMRLKLEQSKVTLTLKKPQTPLIIDGHKGQLQQVMLNLLLNAVQAMPDGGAITITITTEDGPGGKTAVVRVEDTGGGIPDRLKAHIFDSFLTPQKEGSGLGLSIVKRILKSHRGDIALLNEPGAAGAVFRFWLPQV